MASSDDLGIEQVNQMCEQMMVDSDEGGLVVGDTYMKEVNQDYRWSLMRRFLTGKPIHFVSMQNSLAALWKPVKGICIRDIGSHCYSFLFFHKKDLMRVEKGGSWTFDQYVLTTKRVNLDDQPVAIPLFFLSIWL